MNVDDFISRFQVLSNESDIEKIRAVLLEEIEAYKDAKGDRSAELLMICCMNLCYYGHIEDVSLIWNAKMLSMDTGCMIDTEYLCGPGIEKTKVFLESLNSDWAKKALQFIGQYGDFDDYNPKKYVKERISYFEG